jgi:cysteine-rich repeat protein
MGRLAHPLLLLGLFTNLACVEQPTDPLATTAETATSAGDDSGSTGVGDGDGDGDLCGNAVVDPGEECDAGSETISCDGDCTYVMCGDGYHNMQSEQCDDGNQSNDDGCIGACILNVCGDGVVNEGVEGCDDANNDDTDACTTTCAVASCGDGHLWQGMETCDDGNQINWDDCPLSCEPASCGDGYAHADLEECDDGNVVETDACHSDCTDASCGDGVIWQGVEDCEDGNQIDTDACTNICRMAECGDGVLWEGMETCDDGNFDDDDACPGSCEPAFCGDGYTQAGSEECDDANGVDDDLCGNDCLPNVCQPSGARAPFNTLNLDTTSGCWDGNPCAYDVYGWNPNHGQNFESFNQAIACTGVATCVAHVGITTHDEVGTLCQGLWEVYCDNVLLGSINTLGKACAGSAMNNTCNISFPNRACTVIELRAAQDNDNDTGCCGGSSPDSMITSVSAW